MVYPEEYFSKEVIGGFEVSSLMKRCWAAQMEVLEAFDRICRKHEICYYLAYGTLLGAVRSGGFIPWDDDIDLWMPGQELDRLIRVAHQDFEIEGLELVTPFSDTDYKNLAFRLINTRSYSTDEAFLRRYWQFPFMAGLDIFPLNYLPRKEEDLETLKVLMISANVLGQMWRNPQVTMTEKKDVYLQLTQILGVEPVEDAFVENHLWKLTDRIGAMYTEKEADKMAHLPYFFQDQRKSFDKEWFGTPVYLRFEGMLLPCPTSYEDVLRAEFGEDYMVPKQQAGDHVYPYYRYDYDKMRKEYSRQGKPWPDIYESL